MRIISNLRSCSSLVIGSKSLVISTKMISLVLLEVGVPSSFPLCLLALKDINFSGS